MSWSEDDLLLVTGATGLVGSHVVQRARQEGIRTRALVRPNSNQAPLEKLGAEIALGTMTDAYSLKGAAVGVTHVVHCAAMVGDWGPTEQYRDVNVRGLERLLEAVQENAKLRRFVQISSLGVYEGRDHHGTDESTPPNRKGIDGYTLTKVESEDLFLETVQREKLPGIVLRPGFIYGPRDRTVLPRLIERLESGQFAYLGSGDQLLNNTYVGNLVDGIFLALQCENHFGEVYNITDGRLVTKKEFIGSIAREAGLEEPTRHVPLGVAKALASGMEFVWKTFNKDEAPLLSKARFKFLGLNLDFSSKKAQRELGYEAKTDFQDGIKRTMEWYRKKGMVS